MVGTGTLMFKKNADDLPELNLDGERVINCFDVASKILSDKTLTFFIDRVKGSYNDAWTD